MKEKEKQTKTQRQAQTQQLSYYGLYLQHYLQSNYFEQAADGAFIEERESHAASVFEQARREGHSVVEAQEAAMYALLEGLHFSKYTLLLRVIENEFAGEIPQEQTEAFAQKLLPLVENIFSIYQPTDDFADTPEYDRLYSELTGAVVLYLERYGIQ